jgi:peptidoglycan/xylan/chitin deacetylase (PgdA/CDA1 family)
MRKAAREAAAAALHWSGLGRAFELAARPSGAIILMYHSVAADDAAPFVDPRNRLSPAMFERQMAFLSAHRRVVPLSQLVDEIASGGTPPAGTVCITFDDGYLDNLTVAAPILEKHRLPATLFLATGYVERAEAQWADALHCLFKYSTRPVSADRGLLQRRLLEADRDERTRLLGELERQLVPAVKAPRLTMNWDDARKLRSRYPGFDIGGHTRNHIDLRARRGEAARAEIAGCGEDLRRELGLEPGHFAFPYERWCAETRDLVIASGWKSALGMGTAFRITPASDRFALPRVESTGSMTALRFKTSGAYPGALALLGLT